MKLTSLLKNKRIRSWYYNKVPVILASVYFCLATFNVSATYDLLGILALFALSISGYAALGYLINDFFDRYSDAKVGKSNVFLDFPKGFSAIYSLIVILVCLSPLVWLPQDPWIYSFIVIEVLLFWIYSYDMFRLKENGIWGILVDALYAHVVPSIIVLITLSHYIPVNTSGEHWLLFLSIVLFWQFILGSRNILIHQLFDFEKDTQSKTRTLAVQMTFQPLKKMVLFFFTPLDFLAFLGCFLLAAADLQWLWVVLAVGFVTKALVKDNFSLPKPAEDKQLRLIRNWLDNFYVEWMPLILLAGLVAVIDINYWLLLGAHLLLFGYPLGRELWQKVLRYSPF